METGVVDHEIPPYGPASPGLPREFRQRECRLARSRRDRQNFFGHASVSTTLSTYTHVVDASHRKAG